MLSLPPYLMSIVQQSIVPQVTLQISFTAGKICHRLIQTTSNLINMPEPTLIDILSYFVQITDVTYNFITSFSSALINLTSILFTLLDYSLILLGFIHIIFLFHLPKPLYLSSPLHRYITLVRIATKLNIHPLQIQSSITTQLQLSLIVSELSFTQLNHCIRLTSNGSG